MIRLSHAARLQTSKSLNQTLEKHSDALTALLFHNMERERIHARFCQWANAQLANPEKDMSRFFASFQSITVQEIDALLPDA